jgi:hypothetical protein
MSHFLPFDGKFGSERCNAMDGGNICQYIYSINASASHLLRRPRTDNEDAIGQSDQRDSYEFAIC